MKLVVGLGNPGVKYETTRHNAGFLALDHLIDAWRARGPDTRSEAGIWETNLEGERVLLVKPQTFMNLSGRSVGPLFRFFKLQPEDLTVIHDEVDLPPGTLRLKTGGGAGGHNGLRSIDDALGGGSRGYHRVRIGVGKAGDTSDHVLDRFGDTELRDLEAMFKDIESAVRRIIKGEALLAMNEVNRRPAPKPATE